MLENAFRLGKSPRMDPGGVAGADYKEGYLHGEGRIT